LAGGRRSISSSFILKLKGKAIGMKFLLVAASALALSATAQAADFTGPRVEARVGWDRLSIDGIRSSSPATASLEGDDDGVTYGVALGYDQAIGERVIVGVEAAVDLSEAGFSGRAGNVGYDIDAKRDIEAAVRLGTKLVDNVLLYGKVGYTNARVRSRVMIGGTTGTTTFVESENGDGVRVGGGLEVALTDQFFAKAEYRYSDYEADVSRNQVLTGVGFRFQL
jgi:outer membrane immunogenic protein